MLEKYYQVVLYNLEKISSPYYLRTKLESKYNPVYGTKENQDKSDIILHEMNNRNKEKIKYLEEISKRKNLAETRYSIKNYKEVSLEASVYFQQSYEMFKTALLMNENSSPLVEYYALLQCVKGAILLKYELLNKKHFFNHHGLSVDDGFKLNKQYISANVLKRGVFFGLIMLVCERNLTGFPKIDDYLPDSYKPLFSEVIEGYRPLDTFVGSWMLSSIVRYKPNIWLKILSGKEDDIINTIRDFRRISIPKLVEQLLCDCGYQS